MLSYISKQLETVEIASAAAAGLVSAGSPGIEPLSADGRLVLCGFPGDPTKVPRARSLKPVPAGVLAQWLGHRHSGSQFIVWNLSGETYDYAALSDQVVEYKFPGHPAPPLEMLEEVSHAIKSWLDGDGDNVAVVHDVSGRRAAVVAACVLALQGELPRDGTALRRVAARLGQAGRALVPSQRRYHGYFCERLLSGASSGGGGSLAAPPLRFARVIVNGIPDFVNEHGPRAGSGAAAVAVQQPVVCRPCIRLFYCGALLGKTPKPQDIKVTSFAPLKLNIALRGGSAAFKKACAKIPGSSYGCMKASLHDSFKMHSIRGKVGFMPVTIHMSGSHCLPAMCTQKDVNAIVKFMNAVIASEIKKTGIAAGSPILGNKGMKTRIDIKDCGHSDHVSSKTKCGCYASRRNMEKFCESGRFRNPKSCMSGPMANICHWGPEENAKCAKAAAPFKKHS